GMAPTMVWASGALFAAAFVVLVPVAIWIYTLVFAFSSLWFSHYCLAALQQLRQEAADAMPPAAGPVIAGPAFVSASSDPGAPRALLP
ncbi:MAG: hypothetical protein H7332_16890, partial [Bdellovibrionales bacterium]|nr:hypothetical protein [Ramlibacter sp.]